MTDIQLNGAQAVIDCLAIVAPMVLILGIGTVLIKMFLKFLTGRY